MENKTVRLAESGTHLTQMRREAAVEVETEEPTLEMRFPRDTLLTLDAPGRRIFFPAERQSRAGKCRGAFVSQSSQRSGVFFLDFSFYGTNQELAELQ